MLHFSLSLWLTRKLVLLSILLGSSRPPSVPIMILTAKLDWLGLAWSWHLHNAFVGLWDSKHNISVSFHAIGFVGNWPGFCC